MVTLCIELIRQFYSLPRQFRLLGRGGEEFVSYDSRGLQPQAMDDGVEVRYRVPEFDLEVAAQDENPYKTMEYNQLALQLFQMGFFREDLADQALRCLELMEFKNKDRLADVIAQGRTQARETAQLQARLLELAQVVDRLQGTQLAGALEEEFSGGGSGAPGRAASSRGSAMERIRKATLEAVRPR